MNRKLELQLLCNSSLKRTFVHLTFNQVVAGSIPVRPTNKSITIPRVCDSNGLEWTHFGHILGTVPVELLMEQALLTVESPVNIG